MFRGRGWSRVTETSAGLSPSQNRTRSCSTHALTGRSKFHQPWYKQAQEARILETTNFTMVL